VNLSGGAFLRGTLLKETAIPPIYFRAKVSGAGGAIIVDVPVN
jgi:hypothetical protein